MITPDFIMENLPIVPGPGPDPIRMRYGDPRSEWVCCEGTEFETRVWAVKLPTPQVSLFEWTYNTREACEARQRELDNKTAEQNRRNVAQKVAEAMSAWSAHKRLRLIAAVNSAK